MKPILKFILLFSIPIATAAQNQPFWSNTGNNVTAADFLGSINNQPLIFRTNNVEHMRLSPNGYVGIGISNPQYMLHVNGSAYFNGTVTAMGINIVNKVQADTVRGGTMIDVNGTLGLTGGAYSEIFARSGDLRIQSNAAYSGNLILTSGTSSKVGIGTSSPLYKLDVNGTARINGPLYVQRFRLMNGDSFVFGDSTIVFLPNQNNIHGGTGGTYKGLGLGLFAYPKGFASVAIGRSVETTSSGTNAIVIGSGISAAQPFQNTIPNSLMIAFNSNVPTLFVSTATGAGTLGKVGIGTTSPGGLLQVGDGMNSVAFGPAANSTTFSNAYIGFNASRDNNGQWNIGGDCCNDGAVILLSDVGGGLRVVGIPSTQTNAPQAFDDSHIEAQTKLYVRNDGRVIIGGTKTMSLGPHDVPETKLTVDGTVVCRELFVTQYNWADSVFYPDFHLMPLDSVGMFIDSAGHLPNVPTAQDVKTNGSNLAQNDVILLAKIEELTLYMIELQKQNAAMQAEMEEMKKNQK